MSMSLPTETQILVVGAGPNGMACAITLKALGLQVTIVDALSRGRYESRSSLVYPRTLAELDTVGLAQPLLDNGISSKGVTFHGDTDTLIAVDVSKLHKLTRFPTTLLISQSDVESIFEDRLKREGVNVIWNKKVVGMASNVLGVEVSLEDGSSVVAQYVFGADGSQSTVRRLSKVDFRDPDTGVSYDANAFPSSALQIILADIYLEEPVPPTILRDAVSWHLNNRILFCPLLRPARGGPEPGAPPTSYWRTAMVVPIGTTTPQHPSLEYIQAEVAKRNPWKQRLHVVKTTQAATYRVRSAVASTFFEKLGTGNILLVGDAAHVHPPTGGQGLNLGLCNVISLGRATARETRQLCRNCRGSESGVAGNISPVHYIVNVALTAAVASQTYPATRFPTRYWRQ
ncbi:hypothetical protein JB92DRAFT_2839742 [Gautieria morchelliformis]|nr:hypothetical protein JB92DRAFT_2839742 [Gautieria morchelliformis]